MWNYGWAIPERAARECKEKGKKNLKAEASSNIFHLCNLETVRRKPAEKYFYQTRLLGD